ncbi:MAG: histidine phosphatase family protein [Hyphomicrobiales bacterium]
MIRLILMRHAKSSWDDLSLADHDRPLNARGLRAAQQMADLFIARDLTPDAILCSSAIRARQTMSPILNLHQGSVSLTFSPALYEARSKDYPSLIMQQLKASTNPQILMLIGHNFAIQDAAIDLAAPVNTDIQQKLKNKFPTGAAAIFELQDNMQDLDAKSSHLIDFVRPRDL